MTTKTTKKNPQDATLRNVRAAKKVYAGHAEEIVKLWAAVHALQAEIATLKNPLGLKE